MLEDRSQHELEALRQLIFIYTPELPASRCRELAAVIFTSEWLEDHDRRVRTEALYEQEAKDDNEDG